jgi:hypothetical protein
VRECEGGRTHRFNNADGDVLSSCDTMATDTQPQRRIHARTTRLSINIPKQTSII